jgi:hypothetical protein
MENRPAPHAHPAAFPFLRNAGAQSILLLMALATTFLAGPLLMLARAGEAGTASGTTIGLSAPVDAEGSRFWGNLIQGIELRR